MKLLGAAAIAAVLAFPGVNAQSVGPAGATDGASQVSCSYEISHTPSFQACISSNGNLAVLKIEPVLWLGFTRVYGNKEGHALCHADGAYDDLEPDGYGWEAPILVSQSASKVVVRRGTTDGRFTLTQTWTRNAKQRTATVANALKANVAARGVYFVRGGRFDPALAGVGYGGAFIADWSLHGYSLRLDSYTSLNPYPGNAIRVTDTNFVGPYAWVGGLDVPGYCRAVHPLTQEPPSLLVIPPSISGFIRFSAGDMAAGQTKTFSVSYQAH